mgnify:CR=1 FL=1
MFENKTLIFSVEFESSQGKTQKNQRLGFFKVLGIGTLKMIVFNTNTIS